jgi:hypothetical protein
MTESFKQNWDEFCDELKLIGDIVSSQENLTKADEAEGYRYLTRLLRLALEMNIEHSNKSNPSFYSLSHETAKIGADNPDNIYLNANIDGLASYEVFGSIGEVEYLSFGVKENRYSIDGTMVSLGEIDLSDISVSKEGNFKLVLGQGINKCNFLNIPPQSNMLIVRQTYSNRVTQKHAVVNIKKIGLPEDPKLLTHSELSNHLKQSLAFVRGTAQTFLGWVNDFRDNHRNALPLGNQSFFQAAGGDPKIFYLHGYFDYNSEQYLEIKTEVPECEFWNFQLENFWMESLDYRHHPIHLNSITAKLNSDASVTIIVSHKNLNIQNNLITEGRNNGAMLLRWISADTCPIPQVSVKQLIDLEINNA